MEVDKSTAGTIMFLVLAQLTLLCLKGFNVVNWSWLWILTPLWLPYAAILFAGSMLIFYLMAVKIRERFHKENA